MRAVKLENAKGTQSTYLHYKGIVPRTHKSTQPQWPITSVSGPSCHARLVLLTSETMGGTQRLPTSTCRYVSIHPSQPASQPHQRTGLRNTRRMTGNHVSQGPMLDVEQQKQQRRHTSVAFVAVATSRGRGGGAGGDGGGGKNPRCLAALGG